MAKNSFMSDTIMNIGKICLIILCVVALALDALFIYFRYIDPSQTVTINNIGNQVAVDAITDAEGLTEEEKQALEDRTLFTVNLYDNSNQNGIFLGEMQMNYFMSYNLTTSDYRSSGVQYAINFPFAQEIDLFKNTYNSNYDYVFSVTEYDTTDGVSWNGKIEDMSIATALERDKEYIIKIDNQPYSIVLNGTYTKTEPLWGFLWNVENTYNYGFQDLFLLLLQATQTNSKGVGTRYIQIDLSDFFTVKKYNTETDTFEPQLWTDIVRNYCVVKINYSKNGATSSNQSLFNIIANNPSFDVDNNEISTEYWNATITYNLTDSDLSYRYSELYQGNFVSASQDLIVKFANMPSSKINIVIDLNSNFVKSHNYNIVGLDYNAFQNLKINTLTLKSETPVTLNLLDYCLADTNIKTLNYSSIITLIKSDTAINNDCVEVVI